jgi:hypothetical protein
MPTRKTRKRSTARGAQRSAIQRIQDELPAELRGYVKRVRQGLSRLERQIETAQRDARKRFARLLREVSHQLGSIEARGEREWRARTARARHDAVKLLRRLETSLEPKRAKKRARPAPRKAARAATPAAPKPAAPAAAAKPSALPVAAPPSALAETSLTPGV